MMSSRGEVTRACKPQCRSVTKLLSLVGGIAVLQSQVYEIVVNTAVDVC